MLLERKHMENAGATERKEEKSRQTKKTHWLQKDRNTNSTKNRTSNNFIYFLFSERKRRRTSQKF